MDTLDDFLMTHAPTANRPLLGLTVLAVEDSRFSCEVLRLLCIKSGARIRRADSLSHARRHLRVYRPNVLIVDLGLPDGSGTELITEIAEGTPRADVILGTSGDPGTSEKAIAAGADGFLEKPLQSIGVFQSTILSFLPKDRQPNGPRSVSDETVDPDPLSLRDDYCHAASLLETPDDTLIDYVTQFLSGIARSASDTPLAQAAEAVAKSRALGKAATSETDALRKVVADRVSAAEAF